MNDFIQDSNNAIRDNILMAAIFAAFMVMCLYFSYVSEDQMEAAIAGVASIFHCKGVIHCMKWVSFMKAQKRWVMEFKTSYPLPSPKPLYLSIRTLIMALCPW